MSGSTNFPPSGPTSLANILPAYVYQQYSDDDNIQAFNTAFNQAAQNYQNWFNGINLPIYTGAQISGALLDWIAQGIYGISRPSLPYGQITGIGALNTWALNTTALNTFKNVGSVTLFVTSDDIFKRIITWFFFKGDGQQFCITWLKRRIMRFLIGTNGTAPNIDNTYPVSVTWASTYQVTITIKVNAQVTMLTAQIFQAAVASGAIALPFQYSFTVDISS